MDLTFPPFSPVLIAREFLSGILSGSCNFLCILVFRSFGVLGRVSVAAQFPPFLATGNSAESEFGEGRLVWEALSDRGAVGGRQCRHARPSLGSHSAEVLVA